MARGALGSIFLGAFDVAWRVLFVGILGLLGIIILSSTPFGTFVVLSWNALSEVLDATVKYSPAIALLSVGVYKLMVYVPVDGCCLWYRKLPRYRVSIAKPGWRLRIPYLRGPIYDDQGFPLRFSVDRMPVINISKRTRAKAPSGEIGGVKIRATISYRIENPDRFLRFLAGGMERARAVGIHAYLREIIVKNIDLAHFTEIGEDYDLVIRSALSRACRKNVKDSGLEITDVEIDAVDGKVDFLKGLGAKRAAGSHS
jgi:regulator of protease activity HflC (stomatin/prohibitin superfamily)